MSEIIEQLYALCYVIPVRSGEDPTFFFLKDPAPPEIYPLPHPAALPIGGFVQLDPRNGQTTAEPARDKAPKSGWWLPSPADLTRIGFLNRGHAGTAYTLPGAVAVPVRGKIGRAHV